MDRKELGRLGLSYAITYFTKQGYTVSVPLNDTQWYDLIIEQNGIFKTVQCKATATLDGTIDLRCTGGTCGSVYDMTTNHPIDILFCVDRDFNLFAIQMNDLLYYKKDIKSIKLRTQPTLNKQGFQTHQYLVTL